MSKKRGQENAGGAATLVAIITLMIILYILFVPPAERERILGINESGDTSKDNGTGTTTESIQHNKTLLEVQPGKISYLPQKTIEHDLPSLNLLTKTEGMIIKDLDSLAVKKALFAEKKQNITFRLEYPEYTKNVLLSFNTLRTNGELIIKLNGKEIFNKEITGMPEPIKMPNEYLERDNVLEFEASSIGMVFWKVNEFIIENIKITADITEMGASESKSIFLISSNEKDNMEKSSIRVYTGCEKTEVGRLIIEINGHNIFTGIPDCGQVRTYPFGPEKLNMGENTLRFKTEKGNYILDRIMVKTELVEPEQYVWFFQLSDSEYNNALDNKIKINMTAEFADDNYRGGYFVINGQRTGFSSRNLEESWVINAYVRKGGNTIKLEPENNMFITSLKVVIK